jgi:hypothetical protein
VLAKDYSFVNTSIPRLVKRVLTELGGLFVGSTRIAATTNLARRTIPVFNETAA